MHFARDSHKEKTSRMYNKHHWVSQVYAMCKKHFCYPQMELAWDSSRIILSLIK